MTISVELLLAAHEAIQGDVAMLPRSAGDKEFFPQDWFIDRLRSLGLAEGAGYQQGGRNSYPDFWVQSEGFEIKSLSFSRGRPARSDYDSNSTVPSGTKDGKPVFLVFFLYTGSGADPRPVHSLVIAHTDLINADHAIAGEHVNAGISGFGSYADGHIRNRKMYRFPHPYSIEPSCLGRCRLITPASWSISDSRLRRVGTIDRTVADVQVRAYRIDLQDQANPAVMSTPYANAGIKNTFDVWEVA